MAGLSREIDEKKKHEECSPAHPSAGLGGIGGGLEVRDKPKIDPISRIAQLTRTIEAEIIPRLLLANRVREPRQASALHVTTQTTTQPGIQAGPEGGARLAIVAPEDLATIVARGNLEQAMLLIGALRTRGVALQSIFLELLAPAAKILGESWEDDRLSFVDVTIGLGCLQQILRDLSPGLQDKFEASQNGRRILLIPAVGEQHSFGLYMLEVFFRQAGWGVLGVGRVPLAESLATVRKEWIDVIGISKACDALLVELASDITALRRASKNKNVTVLVGGSAFIRHPEHVTFVGADATASDGLKAVELADTFVANSRSAGATGAQ